MWSGLYFMSYLANLWPSLDEWDPKITTFPGLYLVSTLYAKLASTFNTDDFCSMAVLRSVNVLFAVGNVVLCASIRHHVAPQDPHALLHALRIAVFPPLFFFTFLFYTDGGATFFVLMMALLAERVDLLQYPPARGSFMLSALVRFASTLFRINEHRLGGLCGWHCCGSLCGACSLKIHLRIVKRGCQRQWHCVHCHTQLSSRVPQLHQRRDLQSPVHSLIVWPFVIIVAGFVGFLLTNGGIVVGDKANHEMTFHGAQVLYFIVVAASGFGLSLIAPRNLKRFFGSVRRNAGSLRGALFMIFVAVVTIGVIYRFSPVHKFMLADNRHYTFYVWRKFFLKHKMAKFLPTPLYLFFGWRCWDELGRRRSSLWKLVYALAVCLVLIPSPLVEPRYYCVPFILLHLNTSNQSACQLWIVTAVYMAVNALTLYIFLYHPYTWVDGSTARFMW
ncbi:hypothetical protein PInf_013177 [Phytophthora infestans]|nr:hypothetical protein PInf_013177 [Phytophthora infestans]